VPEVYRGARTRVAAIQEKHSRPQQGKSSTTGASTRTALPRCHARRRTGGREVATKQPELHHAIPRCLLRLHERAKGDLRAAGVGAWLEFELEARRWGVPVEIDRDDLEMLVESSTEVLDKERHRLLHSSDWQRWGRRGGLVTLGRYGSDWFALLALRRWGRISAEDLEAARPLR
jgi:hypothetical protein